MTRTVADLEISYRTHEEVRNLLIKAGYEHAVDESGAIDMTGIRLVLKPKPAPLAGTHNCPRRLEGLYNQHPKEGELLDTYIERDGKRVCNYCGSMHQDDFMKKVEEGVEVGPTDKNYKAYVGKGEGKFYYQHLSKEQRGRFIELINQRKMNIGMPGHFYVLPFFITYDKDKAES